jgi:DNA-binding NtrC family response regulator
MVGVSENLAAPPSSKAAPPVLHAVEGGPRGADGDRTGGPTRRSSASAESVERVFIGDTAVVRRLFDVVRRVAATDVTVLIEGETGTGKELVARAIHAASRRRGGPFIALNCAELSGDAIESRFFGHRRGSFTGAIEDHRGFFEAAHGGTLFLDEVSELPLQLQGKLLRVLQEGEITRFGESGTRAVDVRVLAATNRPLAQESEEGRFRKDLFYRVSVLPIRVPSLRERHDDLIPLAEHFLSLHARRIGVPAPTLSADACRLLLAREYPGNVRELENVMIRALVMAGGETIEESDIASPPPIGGGAPRVPVEPVEAARPPGAGLLEAVAGFERAYIERALAATGGNRAAAARALKISYRWLLTKLERYGKSGRSERGTAGACAST